MQGEANPFAGVWTGGWFADSKAVGSWTMRVAPDGSVTGTASDNRTMQTATLAGTVMPDGAYNYVYHYGLRERSGRGTVQLIGSDAATCAWRDYEDGLVVSMGVSQLKRQPEIAQES